MVASASCPTELGAQKEQVWEGVPEELLVPTASHVDLDRKPQVSQPSMGVYEIIKAVSHCLKLDLVVTVHEGNEIKCSQLRMSLEDCTKRRASGLLQVVEENNRATWQLLHHQFGRRINALRRAKLHRTGEMR